MITIKNLRDENDFKHCLGIMEGSTIKYRVDRFSPVGNKFVMKNNTEAERNRVCDLYEASFAYDMKNNTAFSAFIKEILSSVREGFNVELYCWCAPKRCHAETIKRYVEEHRYE